MQDFVNSFRNLKLTRNDYQVFSPQDDQAAHQTYETALLVPQVSLALQQQNYSLYIVFLFPFRAYFKTLKTSKKLKIIQNLVVLYMYCIRSNTKNILQESFVSMRKQVQSGAKNRMFALLIADGKNNIDCATQRILANNSNHSSHFVNHSQQIVPLRLSFVIFQTM